MADVEETSLKGLIQGMTGGEVTLVQGTVIQASPVKIQLTNDDMITLTEGTNLYIPEHLRDHTVEIDAITADMSGGTAEAGAHTHSVSGNTENGGDPEHYHGVNITAASNGAHSHSLTGLGLNKITGTLRCALQTGDAVHLLSLSAGKQYIALGKV